jgi:ribosomal protein S18 acetylase RimI-like enzyme
MAFGLLRPNRFAILARPLHTVRPPTAEDGTVFEMWTAQQLNEWRLGRPGLPTQFFQDRIDGVGLCAVALHDGQVLGLIWVYRPGDYSRMFRLRAGEAELNQGTVTPEHRRRGLFTRILEFACADLAARGYRTAYAVVHAANGPSLGAFNAAGFVQWTAVRHIFLFRPTVALPPLVPGPPTPAPHA